MSNLAEIWIHGFPAKSWEQVVEYATGDAHDRSKLQVLVDGKFKDLVLPPRYERKSA